MLSFSCFSLIVFFVCLGITNIASDQGDEQAIRKILDQIISRVNKGDLSAIDEYWDQDADYVSVDGRLITGRARIKAHFQELVKPGPGQAQQAPSIERVRFLTPELAITDGSWTITGARNADGKELPPIKGRGVEVFQKKAGRWWIVATREMVVFKAD